MPTLLNQTSGELSGQVVAIVSGTPVAGQQAQFTSAQEIQGVDAVAQAVVLIEEVVTSGSQAVVTFSGIPADYRDLLLRVRGRGTAAAGYAGVTIRMNNDSGANYNDDYEKAVGAVFSAAETISGTLIAAGLIPGGTAPASYAGVLNAVIADYRGTTFFKALTATNGLGIAATGTSQISGTVYGLWRATAAITRIDVGLDSGAFVDGSVVSLYGSL